ncbi:MAG: flagellar motor switch protein FliN [candidate division Zixibacteria bacterium]|nr:flagellar motor switch protein FliN [Candidatus Tariuqbacter arcticus]
MNDFITPEQELEFMKAEELFKEGMETVFQTSINPEIALEMGNLVPFDSKIISESFSEGLVLIQVPHKEQGFGSESILFSAGTVAKISDLMVMGDGEAEFNPDEHLDAIQEIVDQVFGAFSNTPADFIQGDRSYSLAKAVHGDASLLQMADESWGMVEFVMNLGEEHRYFHILSPEALMNFFPKTPEDERAPISGARGMSVESQRGEGTAPRAAQFQSFGPESSAGVQSASEIEMLLDLSLSIVIELGRTTMFIKDILRLAPGSIIELDKLSGDPVDIYVNDKKFAEGEVVVIDENFGVRITELMKPEDRLRNLT